MHCDKHANKQVLEATQMLYSVLIIMGIDTSVLGLKPYKLAHKHHPCTLWALACRAHAYWLLDFAIALGVVRVNIYQTDHASVKHLQAMKKTKCFDCLPATTTPSKWAKQLKELGYSDKNIESCLSRVALKNPPYGCEFGVVCVDIPDEIKEDIFVYDGKILDQVETYKRFMVFKSKRKMSFEWFRDKLPPEEYGSLFEDILPQEDMLNKNEVRKMKIQKLSA